MTAVTISYVTTRADHVAKLQRYARASSMARWFPIFTYLGIVALSWLSACLFYLRQGDKNYLYIASGALAMFLTIALPWLYRHYQESFFASALSFQNVRGLVGNTTLVVEDDYVKEIGPVATIQARWHDILGIEEEAARFFIIVAPLIMIAVPRSAFKNDRERDAFGDLLRARFKCSQDEAAT